MHINTSFSVKCWYLVVSKHVYVKYVN